MPVPVEVRARADYRIWLRYSDGLEGIADLSEFAGKGVFKAWEANGAFEKVHLGPAGEVRWSEEIDLCPDALYLKISGKTPEELFPRLRAVAAHAGD
jgi:hypothetical protein